jgi:anti-sigma B factor antagonist
VILSKSTGSINSRRNEPASTPWTRGCGTAPSIISPRGAADAAISNPAHSQTLRLSIERPANGVVVVRMSGEIDLSSVDRLNELIRQRMTAAVLHAIVLDLTDVSFCSSYGAELLLHVQCRAEQRGIVMLVVPGAGAVARLLHLTGLTGRFTYADSTAEAVAEARR